MKYRKKPVVIDAFQFDGKSWDVLELWGDTSFNYKSSEHGGPALFIQTLEGVMRADPGDWVVRGVKGEVYPVKPDIFAMTHEPVEDPKQ
jgi:hypothetical protein